nr:unnamed protein product [Digitaria exilis]
MYTALQVGQPLRQHNPACPLLSPTTAQAGPALLPPPPFSFLHPHSTALSELVPTRALPPSGLAAPCLPPHPLGSHGCATLPALPIDARSFPLPPPGTAATINPPSSRAINGPPFLLSTKDPDTTLRSPINLSAMPQVPPFRSHSKHHEEPNTAAAVAATPTSIYSPIHIDSTHPHRLSSTGVAPPREVQAIAAGGKIPASTVFLRYCKATRATTPKSRVAPPAPNRRSRRAHELRFFEANPARHSTPVELLVRPPPSISARGEHLPEVPSASSLVSPPFPSPMATEAPTTRPPRALSAMDRKLSKLSQTGP